MASSFLSPAGVWLAFGTPAGQPGMGRGDLRRNFQSFQFFASRDGLEPHLNQTQSDNLGHRNLWHNLLAKVDLKLEKYVIVQSN